MLSEAMAHGAVPSDAPEPSESFDFVGMLLLSPGLALFLFGVSSIPQILSETGAGVALPPLDVGAFADSVMGHIADEAKWRAASQAGMHAADLFTYDAYLDRVREMMRDAWNLELPPPKNMEQTTND